jgi:hypothetical protein
MVYAFICVITAIRMADSRLSVYISICAVHAFICVITAIRLADSRLSVYISICAVYGVCIYLCYYGYSTG